MYKKFKMYNLSPVKSNCVHKLIEFQNYSNECDAVMTKA